MNSTPITKENLKECKATLVLHLNLGSQGWSTLKRCVEHPRVTISTRYYKKERRTERVFLVDNMPCGESLDEVVERLNGPAPTGSEPSCELTL